MDEVQTSREEVIRQIEEMDAARRRSMAEYQWRRVRLPYEAPFLFDCRFHGATEQIVQGRHQAFLNRFCSLAHSLREKKRVDCKLEDLSPDMLSILGEAREKEYDRIKMSVRLKRYRYEIADQVREETGRETTGDDIRRMGIGDQVVLCGILQAIAEDMGEGSVRALYDPLYPASEAIFRMSGLTIIPGDPRTPVEEFCEPQDNLVDMRAHMLEHPLCDGVPCYYGEQTGSPAKQALWNLGWETQIPGHKIGHPRLKPSFAEVQRARELRPGARPYLTCQPLELTRMNRFTSAHVYSAVLQMLDVEDVLMGCGKGDRPKLELFLAEMALPSRFRTKIITESLGTWLAMIDMGGGMVTGNTSGMWLGFATRRPLTILSKSDDLHGCMWNVKDHWFTEERAKTVRVLE